jgi:hypothetical protein
MAVAESVMVFIGVVGIGTFLRNQSPAVRFRVFLALSTFVVVCVTALYFWP